MLATQMLLQMLWQMKALLCAPVFWLSVLLVYWQARRRARQAEDCFQLPHASVGMTVLLTVSAGFAGGLLASVLLAILGVRANHIGLGYLWVTALLLLLIRQRFVCFAYSGGLLALSQYCLGWPAADGMDRMQLLSLVAVLHATEAFLVWTTGHCNAFPLYLHWQGGVKGGFVLQMLWPLPLVLLSDGDFFAGMPLPQAGFFALPAWWPMVGDQTTSMTYLLLPALAALGYSDVAVCHSIRQKTRWSAVLLLGYSALLLLLVLATQHAPSWHLLPILFTPLGHEAVIVWGRWLEQRGQIRYTAPKQGVLLLAVQPGSPAARAGLRSEDHLLWLNGQPIADRQAFLRWQYRLPQTVNVGYLRRGKRRNCRLHMGHWSQPGVITAPDQNNSIYWTLGKDIGIGAFLYKSWRKQLKK